MNRSAQPAVLPGAVSAGRTHTPAVARWRTVLGVFKLRISVLLSLIHISEPTRPY